MELQDQLEALRRDLPPQEWESFAASLQNLLAVQEALDTLQRLLEQASALLGDVDWNDQSTKWITDVLNWRAAVDATTGDREAHCIDRVLDHATIQDELSLDD